jgi:hypothetical protein
MIVFRSTNGQIFICSQCRKIHLEFGNFTIDFAEETQLVNFQNHLKKLDGQYYTDLNQQSAYRRKIMVPIPGSGMKMLFTLNELDEIRQLISRFLNRHKRELVQISRIEFDFNTFTPKHLN